MPNPVTSVASEFTDGLLKGVEALKKLPVRGARVLPVIQDLTKDGRTSGNLDNKLQEITEVLVSKGIYSFGNSLVVDTGDRLVPLKVGGAIEPGASGLLANFFVCENRTGNGTYQSPPGKALVETLLHREPTLKALPRIKQYARRPVFDEQYRLCNPGYRADVGILVHGEAIDSLDPTQIEGTAPEEWFPHITQLLREFCFASDSDRTNAVGVLVTGMLSRHFVADGHPPVVLDGNQPGLGKTLFTRCVGIVLDGEDPKLISYSSNQEELGKQILATLRGSQQSCIVIDNAKTPGGHAISNSLLEANLVANEISLRILGTSENYVRDNDLLWFLTMNDTKLSADLVSRALPIRLSYEGDPRKRALQGDPLGYAREHRREILAELVQTVDRWKQQGRPQGTEQHRLGHWARTVGGILSANGYLDFLGNYESAARDFDQELDGLSDLVDVVLKGQKLFCEVPSGCNEKTLSELILQHGAEASKWTSVFREARVCSEALKPEMRARAEAKVVSNFLTKHLNRSTIVPRSTREVSVTLRKADGRSRKTFYCLVVEPSPDSEAAAVPPTPPKAADTPALPQPANTVGPANATARSTGKPRRPSHAGNNHQRGNTFSRDSDPAIAADCCAAAIAATVSNGNEEKW